MSSEPKIPPRASCNQRFAQAVGIVGFLMFSWFLILCFLSSKPSPLWVPLCFAGFALAAAYLFLYSGTVTVDDQGVTQRSRIGTFFIPWSSVEHVWTGSGQLVLAGQGIRLAMPGPEAWLGSGRREVILGLLEHCADKGIRPRERLIAAFMVSKGTRVSRFPAER